MFKRLIFHVRSAYVPRSYSSECIIVEKIQHVTTIGINRPEKRNCIDSTTAKMLESAICDFEKDNEAYAAVLYGTGGNFCSGHDLRDIANLEKQSDNENTWDLNLLSCRKFISKPTVAALNGYTVGGGLELALLCDLRVMEDTAVIGLYGRRFGIPLMDGATVRLPALVGLSRALDLILTGRTITAREAFEWGLSNRIVACGTGLGQALQLATSLVKFPQECLKLDRASTYNAAFNQLYDELLQYERNHGKTLKVSQLVEGAKKFISGIGKHGTAYNITEKESLEWERQFTNTAKCKL